MIAVKFISGITEHLPYRLSEWACSAVMFLFGLTLLQAGNSFDNPAFSVMRLYATENTWGLVLVLIAGIRLLALFVNGTFGWSVRVSMIVRAAFATISVGVWFVIALGIYLAGAASPGSRTYAVLMFVDMFLAVYMGGKAGATCRKRADGRS